MSESVRDMAGTVRDITRDATESTVHSLSGLVDHAQHRINRQRHAAQHTRRRREALLVAVLVAVAAFVVLRRRRAAAQRAASTA